MQSWTIRRETIDDTTSLYEKTHQPAHIRGVYIYAAKSFEDDRFSLRG